MVEMTILEGVSLALWLGTIGGFVGLVIGYRLGVKAR